MANREDSISQKTCATCEYWNTRERGTCDGFIGSEVDYKGECHFHPPIDRGEYSDRLRTSWCDGCGNYKQEPDEWAKSTDEITSDARLILEASNKTAFMAYEWFKSKGINP